MEFITQLFDFVLHIDAHLAVIVEDYGAWTYAILFLIIFAETGLVVTPFLPGDSLLFAAGALSATTALHPGAMFALLVLAAILGDSVNYSIGALLCNRIREGRLRIIKREHLDRTEQFYAKYGGKTIILARFIPIVRTYAPFVAGAARMEYSRFAFFNITGAILWVGIFVFGGYWFGNIPVVEQNFGLVVIAIIILSVIPAVWEFVSHRRAQARSA